MDMVTFFECYMHFSVKWSGVVPFANLFVIEYRLSCMGYEDRFRKVTFKAVVSSLMARFGFGPVLVKWCWLINESVVVMSHSTSRSFALSPRTLESSPDLQSTEVPAVVASTTESAMGFLPRIDPRWARVGLKCWSVSAQFLTIMIGDVLPNNAVLIFYCIQHQKSMFR